MYDPVTVDEYLDKYGIDKNIIRQIKNICHYTNIDKDIPETCTKPSVNKNFICNEHCKHINTASDIIKFFDYRLSRFVPNIKIFLNKNDSTFFKNDKVASVLCVLSTFQYLVENMFLLFMLKHANFAHTVMNKLKEFSKDITLGEDKIKIDNYYRDLGFEDNILRFNFLDTTIDTDDKVEKEKDEINDISVSDYSDLVYDVIKIEYTKKRNNIFSLSV